MSDTKRKWTNKRITQEILRGVVTEIYEKSERSLSHVVEAVQENDFERLRILLVDIQEGPLLRFLAIVDGAMGPSEMPTPDIVNSETGEKLAIDWRSAFAEAEGDYLDTVEPPVPDDGFPDIP